MPFLRPPETTTVAATPALMYRDLPSRPDSVPGLLAHQSEMLAAFAEHENKSDLALELPTGTGKTLTGLLIAEWTRRKRRARVVYACPTQQLARQVVDAARRESIETALLIGQNTSWPTQAINAYEAAGAVAVTTYSSIFNSNPRLPPADLLVFDDAHAGEQYVGEAYAVTINRWNDSLAYDAVLESVAPALDGVFVERLRASQPDPSIGADTRLVIPLRQSDMVSRLDSTLRELGKPFNYQLAMIRNGLSSCLVYVSYSGILIRPFLPPTYQNALFSNARQRVYLSATLGEGGELERAFGRTPIFRLQQPATKPRYGRRFFIFPQLVENADPAELTREVIAAAGKALILAPDTNTASSAAATLAQPDWPQFEIADVKDSMLPFASSPTGTCGLASRYDGIDLPGESCRVVALIGLPNQDNLQERFLQTRARAGAAIAARIRTRVIQGAGRCTRGPNDTAIVIVVDGELSRYLSRPEVTQALEPELQAEVSFGLQNSQAFSHHEIMQNVGSFLNQNSDETWRTEAEPYLTDMRREAVKINPSGSQILTGCVASEIAAWAYATAGSWTDAARHAHEVALLAGAGGHVTSGYRAFWLYLEAIWTDQASQDNNDVAGRSAALALAQQAEKIIGVGSWVRQMAPLPATVRSKLSAVDSVAVSSIAARLLGGVNQTKARMEIDAMIAGLSAREPGRYEPALTTLGRLAGANSYKPTPSGRCDSVWLWDNELWLAVEAKSDHEPRGVVPHKDVRQANDQLRLLASDRETDQIPPGSATVLVSPKPGIHKDGIAGAEPHVHFARPDLIGEVAYDLGAAWIEMLAKTVGRGLPQLRELVADVLSSRGVLPSQLLDRLTQDQISGIPSGSNS